MPILVDQTIDIFCEKLERVDVVGPNRRLIFTVTSVEAPDCSNVACKLILPADFMAQLAYMAVGAGREKIAPELIALEPRIAN
jgi:hypothetical protein